MRNPSLNPHFRVIQMSGSTPIASHRFLTPLTFHASPGRKKQVPLCISLFRPVAVQDWEKMSAERKKQGLLEYETLKREFSLTTAAVAVGVGAYCFVVLSPEASLSYGVGALASLGYLQLLFRHVDGLSKDNVAEIFVQRRRRRRGIAITSTSLQESIEKTLQGSSCALSSPRLIIPAALFGLWAASSHFAENSPIHLQVAPLMFGFFAYKAAALMQTYRDNKDLVFMFPEEKSPEDI